MKTIRNTTAKSQVQSAVTKEIQFRAALGLPVSFLTLSDGCTQHERDVFAAVPEIKNVYTLNKDERIANSMLPVHARHQIHHSELGANDRGWEASDGTHCIFWHDYCGFSNCFDGFFKAVKRMDRKTSSVFVTFCAIPRSWSITKKQSFLGAYDEELGSDGMADKIRAETIRRMEKLGFKAFYDVRYTVLGGRMLTLGFCAKNVPSQAMNEEKVIRNSGIPGVKKTKDSTPLRPYDRKVYFASTLRKSGLFTTKDVCEMLGVNGRQLAGLHRAATVRAKK